MMWRTYILFEIIQDHSISDGLMASIDDASEDSENENILTLSGEDDNKMENKMVEEEVVHHQSKQTATDMARYEKLFRYS